MLAKSIAIFTPDDIHILLFFTGNAINRWDASGKSVKNKHSSRNPETYLKPLCSMQKNTGKTSICFTELHKGLLLNMPYAKSVLNLTID